MVSVANDESSPPAADERTPVPEFKAELSLDQFRVALEHSPDIMLPVSLDVGTLDGSAAHHPSSADERRTAGLAELTEQGVFDPDTGTVHPLLRLALALPVAAEYAMHVQSWTPTTSSQTLISITGALMSEITITVKRSADSALTEVRETTEGTVHVTTGPLKLIVERVGALLEDTPPEPTDVAPLTVEIGLVESRSLIAAIQQGDPLVVEQLAAQLGVTAAVPLLRPLATTMEAGLRLRVTERPGLPRYSGEWFQGTTGSWFSMQVLGARDAEGELTAESLTDGGRLRIARVPRSAITTEVLGIVTTISIAETHARI